MYRILSCLTFVAVCASTAAPAALGQSVTQSAAAASRLRVYIEACNCFNEFLRTEITWVDFVRQPQDADIQILSNTQSTGAGGLETVLRLVGSGRFSDIDHELRAVTPPGEPEDVRRRAVLRVVQAGLVGPAARIGLPSDVTLDVRGADAGEAAGPRNDPWNLWVYRLSGSGSFESEESSRERNWDVGFSADRVTDEWRLSFGVELETESQTFNLDEEDEEPLEVTRRERSVDWFLARALGQHWSFGIDGDADSSTFGNVKFSTSVSPAIEFNLFPYEQYASRQLRFEYAIGVQHSRYNEVTIFDRLEETRPQHQLSVTLDQREPWGTLEGGVEWSQYLHDLSRSRLEFQGEVSLRLLRGLSLEIGGNVSRIHDQLSLPRRGATPEEVLLRLRELQSDHQVEVSVGLSYSFGSIFNNIVNPRFGR